MANCNENKNPLKHSGTSQSQRLLQGLQAGYVKVNEKEYADWIVFANEFSKYLQYYDETGTASGNWQAFFASDISALLGIIAVQDIDAYRRKIKSRFDFIKDDSNAGDMNAIRKKLHELFSAVFSLSKALDKYLLTLPESEPENEGDNVIGLKATLQNLVETKLAPALQRLISYYKAAEPNPPGFLVTGDFTDWRILNEPVVPAEVIINGNGLSKAWWRNGATSWSLYIAGIAADESIFGSSSWIDPYQRINHAANHNLFASLFDQYIQVFAKIIDAATSDLLLTLGEWDEHPAHYALFLAFLKLFRYPQSDINTITQRHLDFYYKEVLRLLPKPAEPDKAHILVELSKVAEDHALPAGELVKAGKDSEGNEILYGLDRETVFNKAKIVSLKSVYKANADGTDDHNLTSDPTSSIVNNANRIFASPIANSDDGMGAELTSPNKEWHPYVNKKFLEAKLADIAMPNAEIGFAVASHYLFLAEGTRKICIRLATTTIADNSLLDSLPVDCYITTEKEWYKIPSAISISSAGKVITGTVINCAELSFTLTGAEPPITNYNVDIHGGTYNVNLPVLRVVLKNEDSSAYAYEAIKHIQLTNVEVAVEVGNINAYSQSGVKQLFLSNDTGPIDPSKPFQPFGARPQRDNSFYVGSKEVFTKKHLKLRFNFEWATLPTDPVYIDYDPYYYNADFYPYTRLKYLSAGQWTQAVSDLNIFNGSASQVNFPATTLSLPDAVSRLYDVPYDTFSVKDNNGFIKISLKGDFGHATYIYAKTIYLLEKAKDGSSTSFPVEPFEPYTPTIQSFYLSYTSYYVEELNDEDPTDFESRQIRFFHIYPFGEAEQHSYLSGNDVNLMPQFKHIDAASSEIIHIGEFYIGIEKLYVQQTVNILFQVMEGTADPLLIKPTDHIHWSYLSANQWINFDEKTISDATRQLVQSGIISFVIPAGVDMANTLLPPDLIWLRASISKSAGAICELLTADAQAALVTLQPNNNADDLLETALPAGRISKLKIPDAAVKKIIQNYSSFWGRPKESSDKFYIRVSERLRHKNRAITIWDYEHLVLEAFPQIYKAKCLNHTKLIENETSGEMEYNEVAPGYVTVITIPNLQNRNDNNPLRPYTNQGLLLQIEEYLQQRISCHVKLGVRNPQFEEVRMKFRLKLLKGFDDFTYYKKQLQQEITQFLTPWAYASNADINFGGKVYKSVLIDFIEERPYVDFITDVEMYHLIDELTPESGNLEEIVASQARSILVSAQASRHDIDEITIDELEEEEVCAQAAPIRIID